MTRKMIMIVAAAIVAAGVAAAQPRALSVARHVAPKEAKAARIAKRHAAFGRATDTERLKTLPGKEVLSVWLEDMQDWYPISEMAHTYDEFGQIVLTVETSLEDPNECMRVSYSYDNAGMRTKAVVESSKDGGATWTNSEMQEWTYDDIVTDYTTSYLKYNWGSTDWAINMGNTYPITRNSNNVPLMVERTSYYQGEFDPIARITNTASADGKTVGRVVIDEVDYGTLAWTNIVDLRDIEWHNTDNQILDFDIQEYAYDANRIGKAVLYADDEVDAQVSGEYDNAFEGALTFDFTVGDMMKVSRYYTDEATGSYQDIFELRYTEDGTLYTEEETYTITFDEYGAVTCEQVDYVYDGELVGVEAIAYDITYNEDGAAVETIEKWYDDENEVFVPDLRIEASNFGGNASLGSVAVDAEMSCRLSGRSLAVTAPGASACEVLALDGTAVVSASGHDTYSVDLGSVPAGVYIVRLSSAAGFKAVKVLVH